MTSAAELFELLWEELADILGTAASATLLRRAIGRAESRMPSQPGNDEAADAFRLVAADLRLLLIELTGPVVVRRFTRPAPFEHEAARLTAEAESHASPASREPGRAGALS